MKKINAGRALVGIWVVLTVLLATAVGAAAEGTAGVDVKSGVSINVQNGSFEEGQTWTDNYTQPDQAAVPSWNTSAFEGKIELFRENTGVYIPGVTLKPADKIYAAELNADEESTLYQVLNTQPSSIYEWSLSHGARTTADTMALIIGPNQSVPDTKLSAGFRCLLSKANKNGRDQFMKMIDWLTEQGELDKPYTNGLYNSGTPITLYSKEFADNGAFEDNAGDNPFSLTPSPFYTQKWQIWLMQDTNKNTETTDGKTYLKWSTYGSKANQTGGNANSGLGEAYYRYTVPTGQRQTLFGFVSVSIGENKGKTFGNFLDGITFTIYHPLTASTTPHGSAIIISTLDNTQVGQYEVKPDQDVDTYVQRGVALNLEVKFPEPDVTFAGVYYKTSNGERVFIPNRDNTWTEDKTKGCFTYTTAPVKTAVELYFVFIKSPMITYDPNGGDAYDCGQKGSGEAPNVYSFKPNGEQRVSSYTAHAATKTTDRKPDEGWRFTGWRLSDDNNTKDKNGKPLIIPGKHTVACNYDFTTSDKQQPFVIIGENESFDTSTKDAHGTLWKVLSGVTPLYDHKAMGLTLVAQWQWKQTFVPCVKQNGQYEPSTIGGTVAINKTNTETAEGVGISYFAEEQETITVTATANTGYTFEGWYDEKGELKAIEPELTYEVGKGDVRKYYARFVGNVVQTYIRQIPDASGEWIVVTSENVAELDHYQYAVGPGTVVTSTPGEDTEDYVFEGWYDSSFQKVADSLILSNKRTLSYEVTGSATYYARFVPRVKFEVRYVDANNNVTRNSVTGEDYGKVSPTEAAELPGEEIRSTASAEKGFRFIGWYDSDVPGANWSPICDDATYTTTMPPVGRTYYAMFTADNRSSYRVQHIKVKPNGDEDIFSEARISNVTTGTVVSAQDIAIPGYAYQANPFTVNGKNFKSNPSGKVRGDGQLVLKLYYKPTDTPYRIEYYKLDAQGNETLADTEDKTAQTDATVSVTGYENKYEGYSFAAHYGKNRLSGDVTVDPMLVLRVYYQQLEHTVRFDMHGFGAQVPPQTVPHNGTATRPVDPTELGCVFGGWYTDDTYTKEYNFSNTLVTQDIWIHAKWNKLWPVDFDMQGHGEPVGRQLVEHGHYAERPNPEPTAEGYVFKGWYEEAACQNAFGFTNTPITAPTTVYAKWTANVTVTKAWEGGSAAEVQVRLLKDGQPYDDMPDTDPESASVGTPQICEQTLDATNGWTHTWTNLPPDGDYTVEEIVVPGDYTAVYEEVSTNSWKITNVRDKQIEVTVTNKHRSDTIGMVIRKEWDDAGNRNRPGSVRVRIVNAKTNAVVQEGVLNAGNSWTWNVAGLPKRQDGGETVRYLVQEVGEYKGYSAACEIVVEADGSYTVKLTNVLTGKLDLEGQKIWNDNGDRDGLRPDSVQLKIYQNAIAEQNLVRIVLVTAEAGNSIDDPWTWRVQDLPVYDEFGRLITYIVVEDPVPAGYADPGPRRITVEP